MEDTGIELRKKKVLITFNHPIAVPADGNLNVYANAVIAEILEPTKGQERSEPRFFRIVGFADNHKLVKSVMCSMPGYGNIISVIDLED